MKNSIWFILIVIVIAGAVGFWLFSSEQEATEDLNGPKTGSVASDKVVENDHSDLIVVNSPKSGQTISSPLQISGEARGNWFFEATFPIKLVNAKGEIIVQSYATAQSEWMTTEFVPFLANLEFDSIGDQNATLILQKDNPSGLPEYDDQIEIPVYISVY